MDWTRQRLLFLAFVLFLAHVVTIFGLHTREPLRIETGEFRSARPHTPVAPPKPAPELDGLNDPMLFASANQHGFSSRAWLSSTRDDYQITNPDLPPAFLEYIPSPIDLPPSPAFQPQQSLPLLTFSLPQAPKTSALIVEGNLRTRTLLANINVPTQYASDVLSNTVVEVAIQPDGFPFSARIISGSGSRGADLTALDLANKSRFAPLPPGPIRNRSGLQWGTMVFQWFTTEPITTSAPPVDPPATTISTAK